MANSTESGPRGRESAAPLREELEAALDVLREVAGGLPARSVFVTGSAATGEWAGLRLEDGWHFLSDVDVGVVWEPRSLDAENRVREKVVAALRKRSEERDWAHPPTMNIGFFTVSELSAQAPKPGTLEMINRATVVVGDRSIREHFPPLTVDDLTWEEAVRLLGNRVLELLKYTPSDPIRPADYYRLGKMFCDLATALLIPEGGYVAGYTQRAARLPAMLNERPLSPKLRRLRGRLIESVEFWTRFRTAPDMELLEDRYGQDPLGEHAPALINGIWCEARSLMEACLEALLPHRLMDEKGRPSPECLSRTSGWGSFRQRIREWRWLARYGDQSAWEIWRRGFRVAFRLSPVEITYLIGFILYVRSVDGPPPCYLDEDLVKSLSRWYPLPNGDWSSGEEVREGLIRLWHFWLPRI